MYLIIIALGFFAEMLVRQRLVGTSDVMAMAANLRAHEMLWRWGVAAELFTLICVTILSLTWLVLLRPVHPDVAWVAIFFVLGAHALNAVASLQTLAALFPLGRAGWLDAFTPEQLAALARLTQAERSHTFAVTLLFSGCFFLLAGPMIYRSGYLPKTVGVLYTLAGVGYVVHTFAMVLAPSAAPVVFMAAAPLILLGEGTLALYLLIKGVQVTGWNARQASLAIHGA